MNKLLLHFLLLGLTFFCGTNSHAAQVTGTVFNDLSGDGLLNKDESGVPKVAVSNGHDVVLTDASGQFKIEAPETGFIFIIKPAGWKSPLSPTHRPEFFRKAPSTTPLIFPLTVQKESDEFQVLVTTDPQVKSEEEIGFYEKSIIDPFSKKKGPVFGITLGDIVDDRFELFEKMAQATGKIGIPWFDLNGNHDFDFSKDPAQGLSRYESVYGPGTYAFEYAQILFIALDDIRPTGKGSYIGGFTETQFQFLKNLLSVTDPSKRVVLMMHIPLFQNGAWGAETFRRADRDQLFKVLGSRKNVMVLSGHTHAQNHVFHGPGDGWNGDKPVHEYNVAAACGSFWGGKTGADGVPIATMWDGTPPGCALVTFRGSENEQIDYLPSLRDPSFQIGVHAPTSARAGEAWVSFYANVFNGHEGWKVEYKAGPGDWQSMKRVQGWDPSYAQSFLEQNLANPPVPWRRLPDPVDCRHLWRAYLPKELPAGKQTVEIRATEPSGKVYSATAEIDLVTK